MIHDVHWMQKAIALARKGRDTSPNPRVGALIVKKNRLIGQGFHRYAGGPHAEIVALKRAGRAAKNATLYVTLEPCAHYGKTPPCVFAIVKSGLSRVVVGSPDPNPITSRRSIPLLKKNGLRVTTGVCLNQASALNKPFEKWVRQKKSYVTLKIAQTLDGKIATKKGDSKWISSAVSRRFVQDLRKQNDAVLVGIRTVLLDNPRLNVRVPSRRQPLKVILDPRLRISAGARVFKSGGKVLVMTSSRAAARKVKTIERKGEVLRCPSRRGNLDLRFILRELASRDVMNLLVEGGGETFSRFIEEGLADELYLFIAPKIIGGKHAPTAVEGKGLNAIRSAHTLKHMTTRRLGPDLLIHARF
jgi:diaminohydroxyphosphoribosylaminopyrimidine deaminase / 5-amino-6-(5-phosphoribosylamino)uracil reductase